MDRAANLLGALSLVVADRMTDALEDDLGPVPDDGDRALGPARLPRRPVGRPAPPGPRADPSGTVRLVDRLVAAGYVRRVPGPDGRTTAVRLTASGRRAAARVAAARGRGPRRGPVRASPPASARPLRAVARHGAGRDDARPGRHPLDLPALRHRRLRAPGGPLPGGGRGDPPLRLRPCYADRPPRRRSRCRAGGTSPATGRPRASTAAPARRPARSGKSTSSGATPLSSAPVCCTGRQQLVEPGLRGLELGQAAQRGSAARRRAAAASSAASARSATTSSSTGSSRASSARASSTVNSAHDGSLPRSCQVPGGRLSGRLPSLRACRSRRRWTAPPRPGSPSWSTWWAATRWSRGAPTCWPAGRPTTTPTGRR